MATVKTLKETKETKVTNPKPTAQDNGKPEKAKSEKVESKEEKFKRLAERRIKVILKAIDGFSNLGNRNAYSYKDEQLDKIFGRLENSVRDCRNKFSKGAEKKDFHIEL